MMLRLPTKYEKQKYIPPRRRPVATGFLFRHAGRGFLKFLVSGLWSLVNIKNSRPVSNQKPETRDQELTGRYWHLGSQDASGDVHVDLDSSAPCWNDEVVPAGCTDRVLRALYFETSARRPRGSWALVLSNFVTFATFVVKFLFLLVAGVPMLAPQRLLAQEPLRAGTIFSATQAPLWAAQEGRYFEKYGIRNLEVIQFSGGQPVTRALIGGDIQISTTGGAAVVNARLKGADTVIIARTVGVFPYTLYVNKDIRDASELKGKRLAVSTVGGSGYVAMQYALRKIGLDPDKDVTMLQIGDFGTRLASLAAGTVQGTLLLPPFTLRAQELGLRPLYDLVGSGIQYPINQITTRQSFIKSQRETVKNFMKAFVAGLARFRTDREFGARVLGKNLRESDSRILRETYEFWLKVFPRVPTPGPEDANVFLELMQVKEQRDWRDFVDTSLMDELDREGFLTAVYK